jgi:hypothetical protein
MKNAIFWDTTSYSSYKNRRFGGICRLHHQCAKNRRARNNVSSNWQPKLADSYHSGDRCATILRNSCFTTATRRHIPEDNILYSYRRENQRSYIALAGCAL